MILESLKKILENDWTVTSKFGSSQQKPAAHMTDLPLAHGVTPLPHFQLEGGDAYRHACARACARAHIYAQLYMQVCTQVDMYIYMLVCK